MSLFNQSTIAWNAAVQSIADCIGASADVEMTGRAHHSLRAAFQFLGGKYRWEFLRAEYTPQQVYAPFSVTGVSASGGQASAASPAGHGLQVDDLVIASGFMLGMRVTATAASGFGLSVVTTGYPTGVQSFTVSAVRDMYDAPSNMRNGYGVKLLGSQRPLRYIQRRGWDRSITDEFATDTPEGYDLFRLAERSKVRLIPPPAAADVLFQRFYRRFSLASASGVTAALDILEDYEEIPIAWAKWHFLTDKGEQRKAQGQTWLSLAQDGLKSMLSEQTSIPDENLGFVPGAIPQATGDRSTRWLDWDYA